MALGKSLENILGNYFGEGAVNLQTKSGINANKITDQVLINKNLDEKPNQKKTPIAKDYKQNLSRSTKNISKPKKTVAKSKKIADKEGLNDGHDKVTIETLKIDIIAKNPFQTRTYFDESKIHSLAENIKENGLIQPIVVIKKADDSYYLLAGERRLRACKLIGWKSILCLIKNEENLDNSHLSLVSAMENLQREDLSPIELGNTFRMLIKTQEIDESQVASLIDKSAQYVRNYIRLLTLHPKVQEMLNIKALTEGQARPLVGLDPDSQLKIAQIINQKNLTVKETLRLIQNLTNTKQEGDLPLKVTGYNLPPEYIDRGVKLSEKIPDSSVKYFGNEKKGKIVVYWG